MIEVKLWYTDHALERAYKSKYKTTIEELTKRYNERIEKALDKQDAHNKWGNNFRKEWDDKLRELNFPSDREAKDKMREDKSLSFDQALRIVYPDKNENEIKTLVENIGINQAYWDFNFSHLVLDSGKEEVYKSYSLPSYLKKILSWLFDSAWKIIIEVISIIIAGILILKYHIPHI
jgi:hypothetical protein